MTAVLALLLDAYRELNAKRLFWVVMALSGLVVASFAALGLNPRAVTIFGLETPLAFGTDFMTRAAFYKLLFVAFGISVWITWVAMILAVVSTAGIFPDFLAGGSVDLYLARPLGRLRLFLVKYACGLLFVTLQAAVFSAAGFLVIGLRGGAWEPGLFLAVPLVVLMFSYLFCVSVLVGVLTRSTVAALLLTIVFWLAMWGVHTTEVFLLQAKISEDSALARLDRQIETTEGELKTPEKRVKEVRAPAKNATSADALAAGAQPATSPADGSAAPATRPVEGNAFIAALARGVGSLFGKPPVTRREALEAELADFRRQREELARSNVARAHRIAYLVDAPLPKTSETVGLLERKLIAAADLPHAPDAGESAAARPGFHARRRDREAASASTAAELRERPASWVIGTSLAFEAVVVALAAWTFCRRDY